MNLLSINWDKSDLRFEVNNKSYFVLTQQHDAGRLLLNKPEAHCSWNVFFPPSNHEVICTRNIEFTSGLKQNTTEAA